MKNDPTYKFLAAVILAGVIVAFASPTPTAEPVDDTVHPTAAAHGATE